ncbi:hypothetical protein ANN_19450 [Periplaneta americana]|uniref:Uncharacterized protein n=1 Tax=Periplaneta americana TaxID=6978 RepID=A0ABQ8S9X7_PERAM|nr:hypothetical protein ANN_19450 [Periplaneta americana]
MRNVQNIQRKLHFERACAAKPNLVEEVVYKQTNVNDRKMSRPYTDTFKCVDLTSSSREHEEEYVKSVYYLRWLSSQIFSLSRRRFGFNSRSGLGFFIVKAILTLLAVTELNDMSLDRYLLLRYVLKSSKSTERFICVFDGESTRRIDIIANINQYKCKTSQLSDRPL